MLSQWVICFAGFFICRSILFSWDLINQAFVLLVLGFETRSFLHFQVKKGVYLRFLPGVNTTSLTTSTFSPLLSWRMQKTRLLPGVSSCGKQCASPLMRWMPDAIHAVTLATPEPLDGSGTADMPVNVSLCFSCTQLLVSPAVMQPDSAQTPRAPYAPRHLRLRHSTPSPCRECTAEET